MTRERLIALVEQIVNPGALAETELDELLDLLQRSVLHPRVSDLVFWLGSAEPGVEEFTPAEIVDRALAYRSIAL